MLCQKSMREQDGSLAAGDVPASRGRGYRKGVILAHGQEIRRGLDLKETTVLGCWAMLYMLVLCFNLLCVRES